MTTHYFPLAWLFVSFRIKFIKPKIFVDGYEKTPAGWSRAVLRVRPGQRQVHVYMTLSLPRRVGPADAVVEVYPGRLAEFEYKAPVYAYSKGSLGSPPQSYNGVGIGVAVCSLLLLLIIVLIAAL